MRLRTVCGKKEKMFNKIKKEKEKEKDRKDGMFRTEMFSSGMKISFSILFRMYSDVTLKNFGLYSFVTFALINIHVFV